jgi:hypothetical protein
MRRMSRVWCHRHRRASSQRAAPGARRQRMRGPAPCPADLAVACGPRRDATRRGRGSAGALCECASQRERHPEARRKRALFRTQAPGCVLGRCTAPGCGSEGANEGTKDLRSRRRVKCKTSFARFRRLRRRSTPRDGDEHRLTPSW